jgi:hypothetical protein
MDITTLVPLPVRMSPELCKLDADGGRYGAGLAVCQDLGLLVISSGDKLQVFVLPEDMVAAGVMGTRELVHVRTLGGDAPMEFQFGYTSGYMAFTDGCGEADQATTTLLLVTDGRGGGSRSGAVHVIDVVRGTHEGYVAAPGTIMYPRGVTTRKSLAAVSCWNSVRVFEGGGGTWTGVRVIDGANPGFACPCGLRFSVDGFRLAVTEYYNGRVNIFCAETGSLLNHMAPLVSYIMDVEDCGSEWVVCCNAEVVVVADAFADSVVVKRRDLGFNCSALATLPSLGLLAARHDTGVQFYGTPDAVAMAAMSSCKVAWMVAACRGLFVSAIARRF